MEKAKKAEQPGERIAKVMARAGLCSRRDAEAWIENGRVSVNGRVLTTAAINVTRKDAILVDGKPLPEKQLTRVWLYYKPKGLMTTAYDPEGRATVFDNLPADMPRVISVGRLDLNSEGLLLLTNDGELARKLELPATAWIRRYRVRVNGRFDPKLLDGLKNGIEIEGVRYGSIEAAFERQQGANAWLTMALTEGKNREIRRICQHFGWPVSRLIRVGYGPFQLGEMEPGQVQEVKGKLLQTQLRFGNDWRPDKAAEAEEAPARPVFNRGPDKKTRDKLREAPRDGKREERAKSAERSERRAPRPQYTEEETPRPRRLQRADLPRWSERPRQEEAAQDERPQRRRAEFKPKERREQKPREESGDRPQKTGFKAGWAKNKSKKAQPGSHHGFKHQRSDEESGEERRRKPKATARYEPQPRDNVVRDNVPARDNAPTRSHAKPRGRNDERSPDRPRDGQRDKPRGDKPRGDGPRGDGPRGDRPRGKPASGHARRFR
ncbi:MAG: pseudouridine synthase [Proteobacteria bacterium]|nr:pseudouridine synthase [Pseudomonadota bacterium]